VRDPADDLPKEVVDYIATFGRQCATTTRILEERLNTPPAASTFYHYTDAAGLKGILESGKLRLSDVFNQNDPSELLYGVTIAVDMLGAAGQSESARRFHRGLVGPLLRNIETVATMLICCFSVDGDDLGQWRAYGDNGRGYAIGFNSDALIGAFDNIKGDYQSGSFSIIYDEAVLRDLLQHIVTDLLKLLDKVDIDSLNSDHVQAFYRRISVEFSQQIYGVALSFKHRAYRHEQEFRFQRIYSAGTKIEGLTYRQSGSALIGCVEFDWRAAGSEALQHVVVGPAANEFLGPRFAWQCLRAYHHDVPSIVKLTKSEIPYRPLR